MGFEPGGRADKLGNRHEGRWVVKQLLRLLNEEIKCVTVEAIGDDEKGVDLLVELNDGVRQMHQCKARNGSNEYWRTGDLSNRYIFQHIGFQLNRNSECEFIFVTGALATLFSDICNSARNSNNPEHFYKYQIQEVGKARSDFVEQFSKDLSLDVNNEDDRAKIYNYLKRVRVELYTDDDNTRDDLLTLAGLLFTGNPGTLISVLITYAESNDKLGSPIYVDELRKYLATQGFYPKNLAYDNRISPVIEKLQNDFTESIRPLLICEDLIPRAESQICLDALMNKNMVILHASAGAGKSCILYELTDKMQQNNILWLPLRLDRRVPEKNAKQYGEDMRFPDSPVNCLVSKAGERRCVLILDQLDAVRWTGMHSASALDVCKELIRQVLAFTRAGAHIGVILSCRTFDMEYDLEIKNWFSSIVNTNKNLWSKVEVKPLPEESIRKVVGEHYSSLTGRQKGILSNPQNLSMWVELMKYGSLPIFKSATGLIKEFWNLKHQQIEEKALISMSDINLVRDTLVDWLERNGKISAPSRSLNYCSVNAIKAFKSFGIIQEQNNRISFCHQSYLDFLIAIRLLDTIEDGGNILEWLGSKEKQSLFRREQLRQALVLLMEEALDKFLITVKQIISSNNVRFHLKHLVLELIGQMDNVHDMFVEYILTLLQDEHWKQHILETVCLGHVPFVQLLIQNSILIKWLNSQTAEDVDSGLILLRSVSEKIPDEVTALLLPFEERGDDWRYKILETISWRGTEDSDSMFELRLKLVNKGIFPHIFFWKDFAQKQPFRTLRLINVIFSKWSMDDIHKEEQEKVCRVEQLAPDDLKVLLKIAEDYPLDTWEILIPHIQRLTSFETDSYDKRLAKWQNDRLRYGYINIKRGIVEMAIKSGQQLAKEQSDLLFEKFKLLEQSKSQIMQEILIEVFAHLDKGYSDYGIQWLCDDLNRLHLGDGINETEWMPAVRLVKALSPYCSTKIFEVFEEALIHYHELNEKQTAKYLFQIRREGHFGGHYWGEAQFFLLPALARNRIKKSTDDLINVLKRRFEGYSESSFLRYGIGTGGWIGSTIDKNLHRLSDNTWIKILCNEKVLKSRSNKSTQISKNHMVESSVFQFSGSLGKIAKQLPERFGKLSLRFPENIRSEYIASILDAIALTKVDTEVSEEIRPIWEPASFNTVLEVCKKFSKVDERYVAISFCRLIKNRADENWSNDIVEQLLYFGKNDSDLDLRKLNVNCNKSIEDVDIDTLFTKTINCVRGVAAEAIGQLLWEHPDWFEKLKLGIQVLIQDPHPVIRMASIYALLPVLHINRQLAVEWFIIAVNGDARIAASHYATKFINNTVEEYAIQLTPIIKSIISSNYLDALNVGAQMVTAYNIFYGLFNDELVICTNGNEQQRKGVAEIAAKFISDKKYSSKCRELIIQFMNDPHKDVRSAVSQMFFNNVLELPENISIILNYVKSEAFADNSYVFFHSIQQSKESLIPFSEIILETCAAISTTFLDETKNAQGRMQYITSDICPLLLRLYEQTYECRPDIADRCLDAWDIMFEKRVGITRDLTNEIEK